MWHSWLLIDHETHREHRTATTSIFCCVDVPCQSSSGRHWSSHSHSWMTSIIASLLSSGAGQPRRTGRVTVRAGRQQMGRALSGDVGHTPHTRQRRFVTIEQLPICSVTGRDNRYVWPRRAQFIACHSDCAHYNNDYIITSINRKSSPFWNTCDENRIL